MIYISIYYYTNWYYLIDMNTELSKEFKTKVANTINMALKIEKKYNLLTKTEKFTLNISLDLIESLSPIESIELFISKTYLKWALVRKRDLHAISNIASNIKLLEGIAPALIKLDPKTKDFIVPFNERELVWSEVEKFIVISIKYIDCVGWEYLKNKYNITTQEPPIHILKQRWQIE